MRFVERLLIRDDIDALQHDLAIAQQQDMRDPASIEPLRQELARLEALMHGRFAERQA
jgi:hypothetical protein